MTDAMTMLEGAGVVPVVSLDDATVATDLARALAAGGCRAIEVTLRTAAGLDAIEAVVAADSGLVVGAGSVLDEGQVARLAEVGCEFTVAPGHDPQVAAASVAHGMPHVPGVATPTEVHRAVQAGMPVVKAFPAAQLGGPAGIRSMIAPFRHLGVRVMPTGGVNADNLAAHLELPEVLCVGGTWLAPPDLVHARAWDQVTALARAAFEVVQ